MKISLNVKKTFNIQHSTSNAQSCRRRASALEVESWALNVECSPRARQRGVALIVTLIMLAVITFMATTFLVLSRRERGSVTTTTDQTTARFAADNALERAKVELLATIIGTTNDQNYGLMIPTNFYSPFGFNTAVAIYNPTNVSYTYANGNFLTTLDLERNIANLLYNPRPPVFVTNRFTGGLDFRFYLDLNRNGVFDQSGRIPEIGLNGLPVVDNLGATNFLGVVGDPQWIGVLRFPDRPHSADNPFLSRWTYLVVPAGQTLDVNYVHNQVLPAGLGPTDAYSRNQGVGTYEINLAAFLADLNTNAWFGNTPPFNSAPYDYRQPFGTFNLGTAFDDARAFVRYRYDNNYPGLSTASALFLANPQAFRRDNIDEYADGPFMTNTASINEAANQDNPNRPWAGSDNTNHFFSTQDFFDPSKAAFGVVPPTRNFVDRLKMAGASVDSYDRYTFYRMLEQLGTDSAVDNRINVNYRNVDDNGNVVPGMETSLSNWPPLLFFTTAAQKMFEKLDERDFDGNLISWTNIPVWPATNNYYTPAVHRVLQMAANIFEATTITTPTNSVTAPGITLRFPCVYRPLFSSRGSPVTNIFISGYELVNGPDNLQTPPAFLTQVALDLNDPVVRNAVAAAPAQSQRNIYGVPWVIGAEKGFPNLNQISMQSVSTITRKLQVTRPLTRNSWNGYYAKQGYIIGVSNSMAVEVWNSYSNSYPRDLVVKVDGYLMASLTNDLGYVPAPLKFNLVGNAFRAANQLGGSGLTLTVAAQQPNSQSFVLPLITNVVVQQDAYYQGVAMCPLTSCGGTAFWDSLPQNNLYQPQWGLSLTNNIRCYVMDSAASRVVDYVQLNLVPPARGLTDELRGHDTRNVWDSNNKPKYWTWPGGPTGLPEGINQQLNISMGSPALSATEWSDIGLPVNNKAFEIAYFSGFMQNTTISSNTTQVPFTPTAKFYSTLKWQANDPLVHYLAEDLGVSNIPVQLNLPPNAQIPLITTNLLTLNDRYSPWGGFGPKTGVDPHMYDTSLKDPLVRSSDDWDFPTGKLPSIGWLGRVHRGTPWQTVYMKSADILNSDPIAWGIWTGSRTLLLATNIAPFNDRWLFDVFTASVNANATRGQLPINQTNIAAWSAVLSGVIVLTNNPLNATYGWTVINPAGIYDPLAVPPSPVPPVWQIVQGINTTRTNMALFPNRVFRYRGDVLATPQLSDASPFLITNNIKSMTAGGINDEVMERIPQQITGLLTMNHFPRFVIYSFGQTLRPAERSVLTSGPFNLLCTNYQVTAETATRAVIRVEGSPDPQYTNDVFHPHPDIFGRFYPPRIVVEQFNVLPPD
jgi:hypothetical protein